MGSAGRLIEEANKGKRSGRTNEMEEMARLWVVEIGQMRAPPACTAPESEEEGKRLRAGWVIAHWFHEKVATAELFEGGWRVTLHGGKTQHHGGMMHMQGGTINQSTIAHSSVANQVGKGCSQDRPLRGDVARGVGGGGGCLTGLRALLHCKLGHMWDAGKKTSSVQCKHISVEQTAFKRGGRGKSTLRGVRRRVLLPPRGEWAHGGFTAADAVRREKVASAIRKW